MPASNQTLAELFVEIKVQNEKLLEALKSAEVVSNKSTVKMQGFFDSLNFKQFLVGAFGIYGVKKALGEVTDSSASFEYQMRRVNTIAQLNAANFKELSKQARNAAVAVGVSPEGYAAALYEALSANIPVQRAIRDTSEAAKLGVAGFTDTATAIELMAMTMVSYGEAAGTSTNIADKYLHTQNRGIVIIKELSDALGRLIPFASTLGVDFSVMNAAMSALTASGIDAFESVTALRSMLQALSTPSEQQREAWEMLGIQWGESRIKGRGLVQILAEINDKSKGSITLANELGINQRGLVALLALGGKGYGIFTRNIEENTKAVGLNQFAYDEMNKSFTREMERSKSALRGFTGAWGDFLVQNKLVSALFEKLIGFLLDLTIQIQEMDTTLVTSGARLTSWSTKLDIAILKIARFAMYKAPFKIDEMLNTMIADRETYLKQIDWLINQKEIEVGKGKGIPPAPEVPTGRPTGGMTDEELMALLESQKRQKEAAKEEKKRMKEMESYTEGWVRKKISDWERMYDYQFALDQNSEKAAVERETRLEELRIKRTDSYYKTMRQENTMELAKIENQRKYDSKMEEINYKKIQDTNDKLEDGYLYVEQLNMEHQLRMKDINDKASSDREDANRQHLYSMTSAINSFADQYGDFLGRTVIQSKLSFNTIARAFEAMLAQMTAQILGRAAVWGLLSMIMPGSFAFPGFANIIKSVTGFPSFQGGGFTGYSSASKPAGITHGQEFVFPKPAVDTLGLQFLNALKNIGTGTNDNRQLNVSFSDKYLSSGKGEMLDSLKSLWREGSLSFMGV